MLTRALWGDWHFSAKDKRVVRASRCDGSAKLKTMFVALALEPIWKVSGHIHSCAAILPGLQRVTPVLPCCAPPPPGLQCV